MAVRRHKEAIHSGHFMISEFEDEEQDDDEVNLGQPGSQAKNALDLSIPSSNLVSSVSKEKKPTKQLKDGGIKRLLNGVPLKKLFHVMSIIYRQKITSPKWNSFRGLRLGWDDKIRLNNVIWRCWHQQFGKYDCKLIFTFANPLDIDYHNGTEGSTVLEGKYWKRKIDAIKYEYKKWRRFYCHTHQDVRVTQEVAKLVEIDKDWEQLMERQILLKSSKDDSALENMTTENDLLELLLSGGAESLETDYLLNGSEDFFTGGNHGAIGNQGNIMSSGVWGAVVPFPNPKDSFYKNTMNADFIQPGLNQLQPSFEDFGIDFDFSDIFSVKPNQSDETDGIENSGGNKMGLIETIPDSLGRSSSGSANLNSPQMQQEVLSQQQGRQAFTQQEFRQVGVVQQHQIHQLQFHQNQRTQQIHQHGHIQQFQQPFRAPQNAQSLIFSQESNSLSSVEPLPEKLIFSGGQDIAVVMPQHPGSIHNHHKLRSPKHRVLQQREYGSISQLDKCLPPQPQVTENHLKQLSITPYARTKCPEAVKSSHLSSEPQCSVSELRQLLKSSGKNIISVNRLVPMTQVETLAPASFSSVRLDARSRTTQPFPSESNQLSSSSSAHKLTFAIPPPTSKDAPQSHAVSVFSSERAEETRRKQSFRGHTHTEEYQNHRRNVHINSEQNRRHSIKYGFEALRSLVPTLSNAPASMKTSKAALLMKGGDYLQQLKEESKKLDEEIERSKKVVQELSHQLAEIVTILPTGRGSGNNFSINKKSFEDFLDSKFESHVRFSTEINWKYWIFSLLVSPLFETFKKAISHGNVDEMNRSALNWIENNLTTVQMRKNAVSSLRTLSLTTDILVLPENLPQEALMAVRRIAVNPDKKPQEESDMLNCL